MESPKTFTDAEILEMLMRIDHIATRGGVDAVLTLSNTVRAVIPALTQALRSGAQRGTLATVLMSCGFARATAYRIVQRAGAPDPTGPADTDPDGPGTMTSPAPVTPSVPPTALRRRTVARPPAASPAVTGRAPKTPLEHYPADALPAHITPGMALSTAQKGGRIWIECLPLETHRDAPFGTDTHGQPWAPYGQDAKGRFLNYLGATLGVAGRTGRGHFVGEPDDP